VLIKTKEGITLSAVVVRKKGISEPLATSLSFDIYTDIDDWLRKAKTTRKIRCRYGITSIATCRCRSRVDDRVGSLGELRSPDVEYLAGSG